MFLLAWLRVSLFSTFIAAVAALPQEALFTSSVTYCNPPETLLVQRFEVAFFPANTSVSFNVSVSSVQPNVNVSANLFLNVYGLSPVNITIDLCTLFDGQLCPLPMYNFTGADSIPLPDSLEVAKKLPAIAFKIPDLEGFAQLTLRDAKTGAIRACVQTTIDNGRSINQPAVKWATFSVAAFALVASIWHSTLSPSAHIPARLMDIMSLSQTIAASSMLNLNYPSVYRAFALNFGWAFGLVSSEASPIQRAIDSMRRRTGGHGQPKGGSALDFVNRKLSPYNDVTAQMLQLSRRANVGVRQTVKGEVQTVTDDSSNVLQAGVPIYVNSLFISTTNAFMTIFIVALIVLAITLALFSVGYAAHYLAKRRSKGFVRGLDYLSYVKAWTLRITLILGFPLVTFTFYQWTLKDSWLSILLSVITLLLIIISLGLPILRTIQTSASHGVDALYDPSSAQLHSYAPLYAHWRPERFYLFAVDLGALLFRAVLIAFVKRSGIAQLALLLLTEIAIFLLGAVLKPRHTKGSNILGGYLAFTRVFAVGLMFAFLLPVGVKPIPRVVIGCVVIVLFTVAFLVLTFNLLWHFVVCIWVVLRERTRGHGEGTSTSGSQSGSLSEQRMAKPEAVDLNTDVESSPPLSRTGSHSPHSLATTSVMPTYSLTAPSSTNLHGFSTSDGHGFEQARSAGRPVNPTPTQQIPMDPSILVPYPVSPTETISSVSQPSTYSRFSFIPSSTNDPLYSLGRRRSSGTLTVGSLLPRRWSGLLGLPAEYQGDASSSVDHHSSALDHGDLEGPGGRKRMGSSSTGGAGSIPGSPAESLFAKTSSLGHAAATGGVSGHPSVHAATPYKRPDIIEEEKSLA